MGFLKNRTTHSLLLEWVVLFLCFGYPLQIMLVILLNVETTPVNMGFRVIYLIINVYLILIGILTRPKKLPLAFYIFLLFWVIYGTRLIYDLEIVGVKFMDKGSIYVYAFAFGNTLIPAIAVFLNFSLINIKRFIRNLFILLIVANICTLIYLWINVPDGLVGLLTQRPHFITDSDGGRIDYINAITVSLFGELLALISIWLIMQKNEARSWKKVILLWFIVFLGMFNLLAGASKGPFISFILILTYLVIIQIRFTLKMFPAERTNLISENDKNVKVSRRVNQKVIVGITIGFVVLTSLIWIAGNISEIPIIERFSESINWKTSGSVKDRVLLWESAWNQFLTHPILGDSFVTDYLIRYPHNLILESLMATGIIGSIFFLSYLFQPFYLFYKLNPERKKKLMIIWIAFLSLFLIAMVSGGLFNSPGFWIISALVIGIFEQEKGNLEQSALIPGSNHE